MSDDAWTSKGNAARALLSLFKIPDVIWSLLANHGGAEIHEILAYGTSRLDDFGAG